MSTSKRLIVAVGILVRKKQLLVCEMARGQLQLPGYAVGKAEDILPPLNEFLERLEIHEKPQQTLYLPSVSVNQKSKSKASALVRIVHYSKTPELNIPNSRYETLKLLVENDNTSALLRAVTRWLLRVA